MTENQIISTVRAHCVERDGTCRVGKNLTLGFLGACNGSSEWAHFGQWRRAHTRGMEPERRHRKDGSMMLCRAHHWAYDMHHFDVEALTPQECEGPLAFIEGEHRFEEAP